MTQDEIRKLLGGYATDALSADERRMLFEAALEDQELFNALENEDALRELLDDPVSRDQVRRALAGPIASKRPSFWSRRWLLGVAIPAAAAVILIIMMNRANAPRLIAPVPQTMATNIAPSAPAELTAKLEPAPTEAGKQSKTKALNKIARNAIAAPQIPAGQITTDAVAAPAITSPAQLEAPRPAMASLRAAAPAPIPDAIRQQFSAGFPANAPLYQGPLVRYSLVRSGAAGDEIRVEVTTGTPGYLALYQVDTAGNSKRAYPANEPAVRVLPNLAIQIPNSPIKLADAGQKLRLVMVPAGPPSTIGLLGGAVNGAALGTGNAAFPVPATPLVVDIPLAPN
jgi:hypothetical protein